MPRMSFLGILENRERRPQVIVAMLPSRLVPCAWSNHWYRVPTGRKVMRERLNLPANNHPRNSFAMIMWISSRPETPMAQMRGAGVP